MKCLDIKVDITTSNSINIMATLRKPTTENPDLILYYNFMPLTIK